MRPAHPIPQLCDAAPLRCSVCGGPEPRYIGQRDFGDNCNDHFSGARQFEPYGVAVRYHRCRQCGFTFTKAFDGWSPQQFLDNIYNDDYVHTDPPFREERPERNAQMVAGLWHRGKGRSTVLDYGGGRGEFARRLAALGLACESTDVFFGGVPSRQAYEIVTCFEVIEHVPHAEQASWFEALRGRLAPGGTLLISTEVLPATSTVDHYYIGPRNGHISIHSRKSLRLLAARFGLELCSVNDEMHVLRPCGAD